MNTQINDNHLIYYALDIDDNILFIETKIHLDKKVNGKWKPVSVSTEEFSIVRNDKKNWRLRNNSPNDAFIEFRDYGVNGDDTFIEDFKSAVIKKRFAPSWISFIECLINGYIFSIITSRGHSTDNVKRALEWLIYEYGLENFKDLPLKNVKPNEKLEDQMIKNLLSYHKLFGTNPGNVIDEYLNCCPIYTVSSTEFINKFGDVPVDQAKKIALRDFTKLIYNYAHDLNMKVKLGFSDDDPKFVKSAIDEFMELMKEYDVKFTVFDTGGKQMKKIKL